jgi:putative addiction module killer protein
VVASANSFDFSFHSLATRLLKIERTNEFFKVKHEGIQMDTMRRYHLEQTSVFSRWLKGLKDLQAKAAIVLRLKQVQAGHLGDVKPVGGGVSELRWHLGPGYRVYFCRRGDQIILLLAGGDKSTQQRDIARVQQLAKEQANG